MVRHLWRWLIVGIVLVLLAGALSSDDEPETTADPDSPVEPVTGSDSEDRIGVRSGLGSARQPSALTVHLSEGEAAGSDSLAVVTRVDGRELTEAEISAVTDRLPAWDSDPDGDAVDFNRPPSRFRGPALVTP